MNANHVIGKPQSFLRMPPKIPLQVKTVAKLGSEIIRSNLRSRLKLFAYAMAAANVEEKM